MFGDEIEFRIQNIEQIENTKNTESRLTSSPKNQVENADLFKPVLNKIMATRE